jgi:hypothetical protein
MFDADISGDDDGRTPVSLAETCDVVLAEIALRQAKKSGSSSVWEQRLIAMALERIATHADKDSLQGAQQEVAAIAAAARHVMAMLNERHDENSQATVLVTAPLRLHGICRWPTTEFWPGMPYAA